MVIVNLNVKLGNGHGAVLRVLVVLPPLQLSVNSWTCWRHMWVEFIFVHVLATRAFLPPQKTKAPQSNSTWKQWTRRAISLNVNHQILFFSLLRFLLWQWLWFIFIYIYILVHQLDANHAPRASVTQVNHFVHTPSTFLRIRADPSMQIFWIAVTAAVSDTYYHH